MIMIIMAVSYDKQVACMEKFICKPFSVFACMHLVKRAPFCLFRKETVIHTHTHTQWCCIGFFLACEDFGKMFDISLHELIPLFTPGLVHSGSVNWDNCKWVFLDELRVNSFSDRFPHYAWAAAQSAHSNFDGSRVYVCLGVTCHLHLWQNDRGH